MKMMILIITGLFMFNSGLHYLFYQDGILITLSLLAMEVTRFLVFFLVCYYFTNKAAKLLQNKETWRCSLKIFLVVNIAWCICSGVINYIAYSYDWYDYSQLCHTTLFMMLRFSGEIVTALFFAIGILITLKIKKIPRTTKHDLEIKKN